MIPDFSISLAPQIGPESVDCPQLAAASAAGFKAFEWCRDWGGLPVFYDKSLAETLLALTRRYAVRMASIHGFSMTPVGMTYTRELCLAANINRIEFLERLGGQVLVLHLPLEEHRDVGTALGQATEILDGLWPACRRSGARIAVENLFQPNQFGVEFFDQLLARFPPDYVGFCYDSGHALISGWQEMVQRYADRLIATHLADNDGVSDLHQLPGTGSVDWSMVVPAVKASPLGRAPSSERLLPRPMPVGLELKRPRDADLAAFVLKAYRTMVELWEQC